jgi:hypothetical protein
LYEDDGHTHRHRDGDCAQVAIDMDWDAKRIRVRARKDGAFALPYPSIRVVLPAGERRDLELDSDGAAPGLHAT